MPVRILDEYLDCSIYLYPTVADAKKGTKAGGSGFLVGVPSAAYPDRLQHDYAVTNRHVIEDARSPVIRINTQAGSTDILDINPLEWKKHPDGNDLAVCSLGLSNQHRFSRVRVDNFLTREMAAQLYVGPGDEVFLIGRFINHQGVQTNQPSVRFGALAMMPGEPIRQDSGHLQESYLIEIHSISGYSGSPVFLFIPPFSDLSSRREMKWPPSWSIRLLGVDWGHMPKWESVWENGVEKKQFRVPLNSGMMGVVPAWQLLDLLNSEELVFARKSRDEAFAEERESVGIGDAVSDEENDEQPPFTQADFEAALRKVARKITPEKED